MKCPNCGTENFTYVRHCIKCGYDFFTPAIEEIPAESFFETDPQLLNKTVTSSKPQVEEPPGRVRYPFKRVMMATITTLLVASGIGVLGGLIGVIAHSKDRLKGALVGSSICAALVVVLVILYVTVGPMAGSIDLSGFQKLPTLINLSNIIPDSPSSTASPQPLIPSPTNLPTSEPTPSCSAWDEIDLSMVGTTICMTGTVYRVYTVTGNLGNNVTRLNFTNIVNSFFILSKDEFYFDPSTTTHHDLVSGDCIKVTEAVKEFNDGTHKYPYMQVKQVFPCNN
jgi:hypothetical protein